MRIASPLLVLAALAVAPAAQTQFSADPGLYVVLDNLDPVAYGDSQVGVDAEAGWRYASGLDAGIAVRLGRTDHALRHADTDLGATREVGVGVAFGFTQPLGDRGGLRLCTRAGLNRTTNDRVPTRASLDGTTASAESTSYFDNAGTVSAVLGYFRRVPAGRVAFQPTVFAGVSGTVATRTSFGVPFTLRADADRGLSTRSSVRLGVALPISARVVGRPVTIETQVSVDLERGAPDTVLRLRFN